MHWYSRTNGVIVNQVIITSLLIIHFAQLVEEHNLSMCNQEYQWVSNIQVSPVTDL